MNAILEVRGLHKTYKDFSLDNISFSLPKGAIMGLIGENGSGKTTIIKLMLGVVPLQTGQVSIFGLDPFTQARLVKSRIGVVYDDINFYEDLSPKAIGRIMARFFPKLWDAARYQEFLARFALPTRKKIKDFSRGMKMKLSLSVALAHQPELLILDEPTSGLDPVVRNEILDLFLEFIQDENHSILVSSHITGDLEKVADYITYIHNGRLIFSESKDELLQHYGILKCGNDQLATIAPEDILGLRQNSFGCEILVKDKEQISRKYAGTVVDNATLDDIMIFQSKGGAR